MSKKYLLKDLKALCKKNNIKCRGNKQEIYDKLVSERVISVGTPKPSPFKGTIPVDALIEIALQTKDYNNVIEQCRVDKAMAKRCNNQFWNKWIKIHNPEVFMVLNFEGRFTYDQLFLSPELLYQKMLNVALLENIKRIEKHNSTPTTEKFTSLNTDLQIKNRINNTLDPSFSFDEFNIFKFRPIPDHSDFYILLRSDIEIGSVWRSTNIGIMEKVVDSIFDAEADDIWRTTSLGTYTKEEDPYVLLDNLDEEVHGNTVIMKVRIKMNKFKIGELTKVNPTKIKIDDIVQERAYDLV